MLPALLALTLGCSTSPPPAEPGNVILVTWDTTRADAVGAYGGPEGITPVFDQLAAAGVRFDMAISHAPTTASTHASMFTGFDPHGHRVPHNGTPLEDSLETVAERLSAAGFDTLAVVAASPIGEGSGVTQGFRKVSEDYDSKRARRYDATGDSVTRQALDLVKKRQPGKPVFLWVHYYDAHSPYEPPSPWDGRFTTPGYEPTVPMRSKEGEPESFGAQVQRRTAVQEDMDHYLGLYHGEVAWQDHQLGELLKGLEAQGLLQDSALMLSADHGEMFYERGQSWPLGHGPDIDLMITRVPMMVHGYGAKALSPRVVSEPVQTSDVGSTLLALAGVEGTMGRGRDLGPVMRGGELTPTPIYLEATKPELKDGSGRWNNIEAERGVVWKDHLLVQKSQSRKPAGLYALSADQTKVKDPELKEELQEMLKAWDDQAPPGRYEGIEESLKEALEALGYVE